MTTELEENAAFEADVRRAAEAIWGLAPGECQPEHYQPGVGIKLHELDGLVRLRDVSHLIMATVSRRLDKTKSDVSKLNEAEAIEMKRGVAVVKWFITKYQLDAQLIGHARKHNVKTMTLENFRNRFFNGRQYIEIRKRTAFGSARDVASGSPDIPADTYVELPISKATFEGTPATADTPNLTLTDIANRVTTGEALVLLAPFGAGKSLTMREVFFVLAKRYLKGESGLVPIAINLREHWGQAHADEILERHARSLGFTPREDLVVAWRAGIGVLLIDGFDEVASQLVAGGADLNFMRRARSQALEGVRDLVSKSGPAGILISGRAHYFDNEGELRHSLGLLQRRYTLLRAYEFTEPQAAKFLQKAGISQPLPDWLPRKPLLLGYLAKRGLLADVLKIDSTRGFGFVWDQFLDLICGREAAHHSGVMEPATLRLLLERLASDVRGTSSGSGPISGPQLAEAYRLETGQSAGEGVLMQLQRLPGLTQRGDDPSARSFVDEDMLAALQGSAIARFVLEGEKRKPTRAAFGALSAKAIAMARSMLGRNCVDSATVLRVALATVSVRASGVEEQLAADLAAINLSWDSDVDLVDFKGLTISGASVDIIDVDQLAISNFNLNECAVNSVVLGSMTNESSVKFIRCVISKVEGASGSSALPTAMFDACVVDQFEQVSTNAAVLRATLPDGVKALLTVLRKLYLQAGGGRKLAALKRGALPMPVLAQIDDVVAALRSEGMVSVEQGIVHPVRRETRRARRIIDEMQLSTDPLVQKFQTS